MQKQTTLRTSKALIDEEVEDLISELEDKNSIHSYIEVFPLTKEEIVEVLACLNIYQVNIILNNCRLKRELGL